MPPHLPSNSWFRGFVVFLRNPPRSAKLMRDRVAQSLNAQPGVLGDAGVPPHRLARG
jgi:hypothetical protein